MDVIRDSIESRAGDVCRAPEEFNLSLSIFILPHTRPSMEK